LRPLENDRVCTLVSDSIKLSVTTTQICQFQIQWDANFATVSLTTTYLGMANMVEYGVGKINEILKTNLIFVLFSLAVAVANSFDIEPHCVQQYLRRARPDVVGLCSDEYSRPR